MDISLLHLHDGSRTWHCLSHFGCTGSPVEKIPFQCRIHHQDRLDHFPNQMWHNSKRWSLYVVGHKQKGGVKSEINPSVGTICIKGVRMWHIINIHAPLSTSNPSCLHTTRASLELQLSSHTVPHTPPMHTSTLPSLSFDPPISRTSP